jgi:protein dithiol oxidoreductase (disulfide-forming)
MKQASLALPALLLAAVLSSCGQSKPPPPHPAAPPASNAHSPGRNAPASSAAPETPTDAANIAQAASSQQESIDTTATAPDSGEAALEKIAMLPAAGQLPSGTWVPGTNFRVLSPSQATDVPPGKVEVIEMFWYGCPHCYALESTVDAWAKARPAYVEFSRVPVTWNEEDRAHARLFYTLKALGKLEQLHARVFDEIHKHNNLLYVPGDAKATLQAQLQFAKANDISESEFQTAYESLAVQGYLQHADDLLRRERIDSVPTFVVDGKYATDVGMAGSPEKLTRLLNDLAAGQKHH